MWLGIVSLFPEMFEAVTDLGVVGRAVNRGLVSLEYWNPRDFADDRHGTVDDRPYGGGPGMVMKVEPLRSAIRAARRSGGSGTRVICLSPQGHRLDQEKVRELASLDRMVLVAGRYEGIDERLLESEIDEEISIGDYVLSGGELAAMVLIDAIARLRPEVLGHPDSPEQESFEEGLLDYPHYTRPAEIDGLAVPEVLLSGDHGAIARWRLKQSLGRTWLRRPDLLGTIDMTDESRELLAEFQREFNDRTR